MALRTCRRATTCFRLLFWALSLCAKPALAKDAFVFLGATGDNALRENGVWQGVFEAFTGGVFDKVGGVDIHVAMNTPHTEDELLAKVNGSLAPLYDQLVSNRGWACLTQDCSVSKFISKITSNIWDGREPFDQAANMKPSLTGYDRITVYLSIPPTAFGTWSEAAIKNWGDGPKHRVHLAAEKPFGTSTETADQLEQDILGPGLPEGNLHLVDHWLSFFMNRHLLDLRALVLPRLGVWPFQTAQWDSSTFGRVVVTEYEPRGLEGRGGFFDGVGQVRDMVQSHLLQVMALSLIDTATADANLNKAKLAIFEKTSISGCRFGQYDGFLLEPKLTFHPKFADSTLCWVDLAVDTAAWRGVPITITTGKVMGMNKYTVEFYQRLGPGVLTFEIGKEEEGIGGVRVQNWELRNAGELDVPAPGFGNTGTIKAQPAVSRGNGFILNYSSPSLYFPKPYAMMAASLLTRQYSTAFVPYPQCRRSWEIVTGSSTSMCLDPLPGNVGVYKSPDTCGNAPPAVCFEQKSVQYLYDVAFKCTPEHDASLSNVSFYKAKCNISRGYPNTLHV